MAKGNLGVTLALYPGATDFDPAWNQGCGRLRGEPRPWVIQEYPPNITASIAVYLSLPVATYNECLHLGKKKKPYSLLSVKVDDC